MAASYRKLCLDDYTLWLKEESRFLLLKGELDAIQCSICFLLVIDPWQCEGKRYCNSCRLQKKLENGFPDKFAKKEILLLRCHCYYNNCPWEGLVHQFEEHAKQCQFNKEGKCYEIVGCEDKGSKDSFNNPYDNSKIIHNIVFLCLTIFYTTLSVIKQSSTCDISLPTIIKNIEKFNTGCSSLVTGNIILKDKFIVLKQKYFHYLVVKELTANEDAKRISYLETYYSILMLLEDIQKRYKSLKSYLQNDKSSMSKEEFFSKKKIRIEKKLRILKELVTANEIKFRKMKIEVRNRKNISLDGYNILRFDDMAKMLHRARLGKNKELQSQPMWTDQFGYKFCILVLYVGEERHHIKSVFGDMQPFVSIYVQLMKGEYDDLLPFPFPYPIKISIKNRIGWMDKTHILMPSVQESFQRCFDGGNRPIGFSMFIQHDELLRNGYVKDDTMFIEISVLKDKCIALEDYGSVYASYEYSDIDHFGVI